MPKVPRSLCAVLAAGVLAGCTLVSDHRDATPPSPTGPVTVPTAGDPAARAAAIAAQLGEVDLVGQVLMLYAYGNDADKVTAASAAANRKYAGVATPAEMVATYRLGGLILVGWSADDPTAGTNKTSNVDSPDQVARLTAGLQTAAAKLPAALPLLISTDQEYGAVTRIKTGITQLPSAMALGAAGDPKLTEKAWRAAGSDLAAIGLNVDFAPDSDVLGPLGSGVIGSRSYGSEPKLVSDQVAAAVRGLQANGVAATLKHFPGHGHTTADSHTTLPALTQSRAALDSDDLPPFAAGIAAGADLVMSGHLDVRSIDPGVPASLSTKVLVDLLRGTLGFTGVVVTDSMNMAPVAHFGPAEAAVRALLAGNDILLMPPDPAAAQRGLLDALHSGRLPKDRLVQAARRILTLKLKLASATRSDPSTLDSTEHRAAAADVAASSVTILRGGCGVPLVRGPVRITASGSRDQPRTWLTQALRAQGLTVGDSGGSVVHLVGYGDTSGDLSASATVTVAMDTPYVLRSARSAALVATYSSSQASMTALAAVLAGKAKAPGRSPVAVTGLPRSAC